MKFEQLHSTLLENGSIPVMIFEFSLISNFII